ncbi:uncharacterized protein Tco025E_02176 [Trypanosoma conorhini]|uniref:Uncharacterized protein n=1 Tax=Trypanosoma conorhini TaxID=83891 RepID=A0A3R7M2Y0_9TRYP|nr:uncharacterized protein Tco025E_02176 [Trypanosoma conorhini]RNF25587.1 hypothetical protein Tco025E_02176 [Trypanosoma conorhini]
MNRRRRSSRSGGNLAYGRPPSSPGGLRSGHREELPVLPEMPSFFPDPIALDAEDRYLKQFRDEMFKREYGASMRAVLQRLRAQLQEHGEKPKQRRGGSGERSFNSSQDLGGSRKSQVDVKGARGTLEIGETPLSPAEVALPRTLEQQVSDVRPASSSKGAKAGKRITKGEATPKKSAEVSAQEPEVVASMLSILTTTGQEAKVTSHRRDRSPELPVYLTEPFPVPLFALAEEIGMQNLTAETRDAVKSIAEAKRELGLKDDSPLGPAACEGTPRRQASTAGNDPTSAVSPVSHAVSASTMPSPRSAFTFPLADAFVLEAEQHIASEMFCESICEEIVRMAAEVYVTRDFDAMATAYTACSVWDEVHDSVVRSFVPHNPQELTPHKASPAAAPTTRQVKPKRAMNGNPTGAASPGAEDEKERAEFTRSPGDSLPYFGLLPQWASSPSLLDAEAILSFHCRGTTASRPFSGNGLTKPNAMVRQEQGLTFSRLLNASLKKTERQSRTPGVVAARFTANKTYAVAETKTATTEEDADSPGTPPTPIALDDYARYVLPKVAELQRRQSAEEKEKEGEREATKWAGVRRKSSRFRRNSKNKESAAAMNVAPRKEEGEGEAQAAARETTRFTGDGNEVERPQSTSNKGRRRRPQNMSYSDLPSSAEANRSTRTGTPGQVVEDDFTKALRQLPQGYFAPSTAGSSGAANPRNPVPDSLVFIEGDRALTFSTATKKKKQQGTATDANSSTMSKASMHVCRGSASHFTENIWYDDGTAKLSVNITKGGRAALSFYPKSPTAEATAEAELAQQAQPKEAPSPSPRGRYVVLSRKQQKALEDRRRRQKEAAEQAEYESMFVTLPPPPANANTDATENTDADAVKGRSPEPQHPVRIVAEPGVVVERLPDPETEKEAKAKSARKGKFRGRQAKTPQGRAPAADADVVLSDGGEWIVPEGKYQWSGFNPAAEESNAAAGAATARSKKGPLPPQASTARQRQDEEKQQRQGEREGKDENKMKGSLIAAKPPAQPSMKLMGRPVRRVPAVVASSPKREEAEGQKPETGTVVAEGAEKAFKVKYAASVEPRGAQNVHRRHKLPRLPQQPLISDRATHDTVSCLKTPLASELDSIRHLASILQDDPVDAEV